MIPGLSSPGPKYTLPGSFEKAKEKSKHPTWGGGGAEAFKSGRFRCEEVRFHSRRHMREMVGHFSPGPLYDVPGTVGGATGNFIASTDRLLSHKADLTGTRVKLSAADVGGRPCFNTTSGSFADGTRKGGTAQAEGVTAYWRSATMVQPNEWTMAPTSFGGRQIWVENKDTFKQTKLQDEMKASLKERWRDVPSRPFRQVPDMLADPPLAFVFGPGKARTDYGKIGGMDRDWRESKIQGHKSFAPKIGPAPVTGPLRYAFIQNMGPNSVPRDSICSDFDGGRQTTYKPRRPVGPKGQKFPQYDPELHASIPHSR